jgi:hypothetical protein
MHAHQLIPTSELDKLHMYCWNSTTKTHKLEHTRCVNIHKLGRMYLDLPRKHNTLLVSYAAQDSFCDKLHSVKPTQDSHDSIRSLLTVSRNSEQQQHSERHTIACPRQLMATGPLHSTWVPLAKHECVHTHTRKDKSLARHRKHLAARKLHMWQMPCTMLTARATTQL